MKKREAMMFLLVVSAVLLVPAMGFADCPDRVDCGFYNIENFVKIGEIRTPTCYRFFVGCAPWHCGGNKTNKDYWLDRCKQEFGPRIPKGKPMIAEFPTW